MKTPDEIKKGLECCTVNSDACGECPYPLGWDCREQPMVDALAYIQQLEADNSRKDDTIRNLTELLNAAHEETAKVRRERDAAVKDLWYAEQCNNCKHRSNQDECNGNGCCYSCDLDCPCVKWPCEYEWRGVCPENTEGQSND